MCQRNNAPCRIVLGVGRRWGTRAAVVVLLALGACATPPPADDPEAVEAFRAKNDPMEPLNRALFDVNGGINQLLLGPLGYSYRWAVPEEVRRSIRNVLANASGPVRFAEHLLQGKFCRAGDTLLRLAINTTLGLGGLIDLAADMRVPAHPTDFGLTLARWGMPEGPYLFVPVVGSTGPRDLGGMGIELAADPLSWIVSGRMIDDIDWGRLGMLTIDSAEQWIDQAEELNRTALDPYAMYRSMYNQHRAYQVERAGEADRGSVCGDRP